MATSTADVSKVLEGQAEVVDAVLAASRVFVAVASNALAGLSPEVTCRSSGHWCCWTGGGP